MNALIAKIEQTLARESDVVLGYLFGSRATGLFTPFSDVDVGVLLKDGTTGYYLDRERELSVALTVAGSIPTGPASVSRMVEKLRIAPKPLPQPSTRQKHIGHGITEIPKKNQAPFLFDEGSLQKCTLCIGAS